LPDILRQKEIKRVYQVQNTVRLKLSTSRLAD